MQYCSRALPSLERCERPSTSVASFSADHPGGLAQGPDEKKGRAGWVTGFAARTGAPASAVSVNSTLLTESTRRVGTAWAGGASKPECGDRKAARKIRTRIVAALHNSLNLF